MNNMLPTDYQNFIATSRYARWLDDEGRRETWSETVSRYVDYMHDKVKFSKEDKYDIEQAILGLEVMPSMRAMMSAGTALERRYKNGVEDLKKANWYLELLIAEKQDNES